MKTIADLFLQLMQLVGISRPKKLTLRILVNGKGAKMNTLSTIERETLSVIAVDAKGNQAFNADGTPVAVPAAVWSIDAPVAALFPNVPSSTCDLVGVKPGSATVTVSAVVAGKTLSGTQAVQVNAAPAVGLKVQSTVPVLQ